MALPTPGVTTNWGEMLNEHVTTGQDPDIAAYINDAASQTRAALNGGYARVIGAASGTDDTAKIQGLLNGGGLVRGMPGQTYRVSSLTIGSDTVLDMTGCTIQRMAGAAGHMVVIAAATRAAVIGGHWDGNGANATTSDRGIQVEQNSAQVAIRGVSVTACRGAGVGITDAQRVAVSGGHASSCAYGLVVTGTSTDITVTDFTALTSTAPASFEGGIYVLGVARASLTNVHARNGAGNGFSIGGGASDVVLTGCVASGNGTSGGDKRGFNVDDTGTTRITFEGCVAAGNAECGFYSTSTPTYLSFVGCTAHGNNTAGRTGGHGFEVPARPTSMVGCVATGQLGDGGVSGTAGAGFYPGFHGILSGCRAEGNYGDGFRVHNAQHVTLKGCTARNNSSRGAGFHHGIRVWGDSAGACDGLMVEGCQAYDDRATRLQGYGLSVEANVNFYVLVGNIIRAVEHATGGLNDAGTTATKQVANNLV